jgi:hypothetical protein
MDKRSTHYGDVSKWIEKVINSCETYQQTFTVYRLINNFRKQLMDNTPDKYWNSYQYDVIRPLEIKLKSKRLSFVGQNSDENE